MRSIEWNVLSNLSDTRNTSHNTNVDFFIPAVAESSPQFYLLCVPGQQGKSIWLALVWTYSDMQSKKNQIQFPN